MVKKIVAILLILMFSVSATAFDQKQVFNHYAENQNLTDALYSFARSHNLIASFSPGVQGKISGHFENISSKDFLESMRAAFGISWYQQSGVIHFYNQSEIERAFISPRVISAPELLNMLKSSSIISSDLPVEIMPNSDMLVINGPAAYINQIRSAIAAFEEAQTGNFVMQVFPLKYAWAEDISVNSMDTKVTIPGVASILKAMVSGSNLTGSTVTQIPSSVPALMGQGLSSQGAASASSGTSGISNNPGASSSASGPMGVVNIIADPRVNAVLITDAQYRMPYYEKVIADLDKPVELVEIHAAIVDIDSSFNRELGVDFQGSGTVGDYTNVSGSSGQKGGDGAGIVPGVLGGSGLSLSTLYSFGADFFLAKVQALESDDNARILGKPSVLTMDNVQATLENTSTYYIKVEGKDAVDLFKVEAGTILKVTPHIIENPNGSSSIKLVVSVQDDQSGSESEQIGALPPIKQTKINTQAIVNEGQSLLIGGYYYEQAVDGDSGVPFVKDIPLVGNLFKTTNKKTKKMERLILITPRIIRINDDYNNVPNRVDDPSFSRSPTQSDYADRVPVVQAKGGCAKKSPTVSNPTLNPPVATQAPGTQAVTQPTLNSPVVATPTVNPTTIQPKPALSVSPAPVVNPPVVLNNNAVQRLEN